MYRLWTTIYYDVFFSSPPFVSRYRLIRVQVYKALQKPHTWLFNLFRLEILSWCVFLMRSLFKFSLVLYKSVLIGFKCTCRFLYLFHCRTWCNVGECCNLSSLKMIYFNIVVQYIMSGKNWLFDQYIVFFLNQYNINILVIYLIYLFNYLLFAINCCF